MRSNGPRSPPTARVSAEKGRSSSRSAAVAADSGGADAHTALITPTKSEGQQRESTKRVRKQKLQPAVERGAGVRIALKGNDNRQKKKRSHTSAKPTLSTASGGRREAGGESPSASAIRWPPVSSSKSLPPLTGRVSDILRAQRSSAFSLSSPDKGAATRDTIEFEVNQECTSIGLVPSGRLAVAGFTDGTLRLLDLTGVFAKDRNHPDNHQAKEGGGAEPLFDDDASTSSSSEESFRSSSINYAASSARNAQSVSVDSRSCQRYGTVACQIQARGVHTSLLMDVAISEDGLYAFGGVQRGSVELAAVYLGDVENYLDKQEGRRERRKETPGLLDLIQVDWHADAKLKGFGACTRLWNGWERARSGAERPEYLLLTGKGIKNIHIWSYRPSRPDREEESAWMCLYDTPGNGNSICQLYFRRAARGGTLQAISKSDNQKLRVWDLSYEQQRIAVGTGDHDDLMSDDKPKRPLYVDLVSTEGTVGVCGPYAFASGSLGGMHNIINVVGMDADDASSPFNCTELALPLADAGGEHPLGGRPSRTGRQQRGGLRSVVNVAGLAFDAGHVLLQLSDGSVVHYSHDRSGHPVLLRCPSWLCATSVDYAPFFGPLACQTQHNRRMALARVGSPGIVLFAVSSFNETTSRGAIMLRVLPGSSEEDSNSRHGKYWGFNGLRKKWKQAWSENQATLARASSCTSEPSVGVVECTPPAKGIEISCLARKIEPSPDPSEAVQNIKSSCPSRTYGVKGEKRTAKDFNEVNRRSCSRNKHLASEEDPLTDEGGTQSAETAPFHKFKDKKKSTELSLPIKKGASHGIGAAPIRDVKDSKHNSELSETSNASCLDEKYPSELHTDLNQMDSKRTESTLSAVKNIVKISRPSSRVGEPRKRPLGSDAGLSQAIVKSNEEALETPKQASKVSLLNKQCPVTTESCLDHIVCKRVKCNPFLDAKTNKKMTRKYPPKEHMHNSTGKTPQHSPRSDKCISSYRKHSPESNLTYYDGTSLEQAHPSAIPTLKDEKNAMQLGKADESILLSKDPVEHTPVPVTKGSKSSQVRKVTPGDPPAAPPFAAFSPTATPASPGKEQSFGKVEQMDCQLECIAQGYELEPVHSPQRFDANVGMPESSVSDEMPTKNMKNAGSKHERFNPEISTEKVPTLGSPPRSSVNLHGLPTQNLARKKSQTMPKKLPTVTGDACADPWTVPSKHENGKVGTLSVTTVDHHKVAPFPPELSSQPVKRTPLLVERLPIATVGDKLAKDAKLSNHHSCLAMGSTLFQRQCEERVMLAAKHRAEHEMLRKRVLQSIRFVLSTWDLEAGRVECRSRNFFVESARQWFDEALASHQEMLNDMLDRQVLEAEALLAKQTLSSCHAPILEVNFPFPEVFEQARQEMLSLLK